MIIFMVILILSFASKKFCNPSLTNVLLIQLEVEMPLSKTGVSLVKKKTTFKSYKIEFLLIFVDYFYKRYIIIVFNTFIFY